MYKYNEDLPAVEATERTKRQSARYHVVKHGITAQPPPGKPAMAGYSYSPPRRGYLKITGVIIMAVLLILVLFSKTIYSYNLPVITVVKPENGKLSKLEISSGVAIYSEVEKLFASMGGKVEDVLVKEGDSVAEGQKLYRVSFDRDEAERKLREIQNSRDKLQIDIQSLNLRIEKQSRYMTELADEIYTQDEISEYELEALNIDIRKAREELKGVRESYDDGEATELDVNLVRYTLQALYLKQEELERKLEEQRAKARKEVLEQEKVREDRLNDYKSDISALKLDLRAINIELDKLSIQEEPYRKVLEDFDIYSVVTAPVSGIVVSLNAVKGETILTGQLIASVGTTGTYEIECPVSRDNNFVIPGDIVALSNSSHVVKGNVAKVTPAAGNKTVTVLLESDEVISGETFDVTFKKESSVIYTLVPNGAVNRDNDGYFLNQVKRRDGILGREYYLERLDVYVGESDLKNTVIVQGVQSFEPIVLISNKPVTKGDIVSLSNEGDFFEK